MGYKYDAMVGIDGAERAFEELLKGTEGQVKITEDEYGGIMGVVSVEFAFICQIIVLAGTGVLFYILCEDDTQYKHIHEDRSRGGSGRVPDH